MTTATKALSEMTLSELVQEDIANLDRFAGPALPTDEEEIAHFRAFLRHRREIRREIDRRKAQQS